MVLAVIGQEAQPLVAKHHPRREDRLIPFGHHFQLPGPQHEMSEFGRADRLRDGAELAHRGYVVHRSASLFCGGGRMPSKIMRPLRNMN
jgi:hypothetical protein